jgi:hypothetical protein
MQLAPGPGAKFWQSDAPLSPSPGVYTGEESPRYAGFASVGDLASGADLPLDGERRYLGRLLRDSGPAAEAHALLMVVAFEVPARQTKDVEAWYVEEHIGLLMKVDGWLRVRHYRVERFAGPVRWTHVAIHELRDRRALDTPEREVARTTAWRARLQRDPWFDRAGRWFYEPLAAPGEG